MVAFKSAGTVFTTTNGTTFTGNVPTGAGAPVSGDLLLPIGLDWAGTGTVWTTPTGWTLVRNDNDGSPQNIGVHEYNRYATGSDTNQNFTLSVAEAGVMFMLCYSSPDATSAIDVSGATIADHSTASVTLTTPSVTTTVPNDVLVLIFAVASDNSGAVPAFTTPTGTTLRASGNVANGPNELAISVYDVVQAAAGASATYSTTVTNNATSTYGAAAIAIALKGTAAGPSDPFPAGYRHYIQRPATRPKLAR